VDPYPRSSDWMPITPKTGSLFHADSHVLGWTEEEVLSMSIFDLLHPDDLEHTRAGFELTQVGQPALRFANRYRCKNGSYRWISWDLRAGDKN
jgi:PAS domain S-box-containing protein